MELLYPLSKTLCPESSSSQALDVRQGFHEPALELLMGLGLIVQITSCVHGSQVLLTIQRLTQSSDQARVEPPSYESSTLHNFLNPEPELQHADPGVSVKQLVNLLMLAEVLGLRFRVGPSALNINQARSPESKQYLEAQGKYTPEFSVLLSQGVRV